MKKKKSYKCGLCGKEYSTVAERAKCESACIDKQVAIEEKAKKEKAKQYQEERRQEVIAALVCARNALEAYTKEYGSFSYSSIGDKELETRIDNLKTTINNVDGKKPETVSKSEKTSNEPWPFDNWPFTSKLFNFFW